MRHEAAGVPAAAVPKSGPASTVVLRSVPASRSCGVSAGSVVQSIRGAGAAVCSAAGGVAHVVSSRAAMRKQPPVRTRWPRPDSELGMPAHQPAFLLEELVESGQAPDGLL